MASQEITNIIIATSVILLLFGIFIFSIMILYNKRKSDYREGLRTQQEDFQQELLRTQIEIQEQTLKNISQEIHDNIGQSLSLAKLNLNTIDIEKSEVAISKIDSTRDLVGKAIHDLRDLSKSLNTDSILSAGLVKAIELELAMIEKSGAYQTGLTVSGRPVRIDPKKEIILFRIIQEAVNNIIKHAKAGIINVNAAFSEETLVIRVTDDGTGFATGGLSEDGSGLRNMKSRAALIGGNFDIATSTNGTTITVTTPITEI
jgi:signal transduction histidine kinase